MLNREVKVIISSEPGQGRSTILECIRRTLEENGIRTSVLTQFNDMTPEQRAEIYPQAIEDLGKCCHVILEEVQTSRVIRDDWK